MAFKGKNLLTTLVILFISTITLLAQNEKPTAAQINAAKAMQAFEKKDYDGAIAFFKKALETDKNNADYMYEIGLAYVMKKDFEKAIAQLQSITDLSTARDNYYQLLGNLYAERDDSVKARETYQAGLKRFPKSGRLRMELALLHLQHRMLDEALDELEEGIQTDPTFPLNYFWAAQTYKGTNEKIWCELYGELFENLDPNSVRSDKMHLLVYDIFRVVFEDFEQSKKMTFSKVQKGSTDASSTGPSFEDKYNEIMTASANGLLFNRDFEIPIASIDTIRTRFITTWYKQKLNEKFPNAVFERQKQIADNGLMRPYTYYIFGHAKPLEFEDYLKKNKKEYDKLLEWIKAHPFTITDKNKFSRFFY